MTTEFRSDMAMVPVRGGRLPGFSGTSPSGGVIRLRDFYMRRNLALVFTHGSGCEFCRRLLDDLASIRTAAQAEAGEILAVIPGGPEDVPTLPYPIVLDDAGEIHRRYGLIDGSGHSLAAIFLADRYGVVFESSIADEAHAMLPAEQVPGWLEFIACRCS